MTKSIKVETQVIRGFEACHADSKLYKAVAEGSAEKFGKDSRAYQTLMNGINTKNGTGSQFFFNTETELYLPEGRRVARLADLGKIYDADTSFFKGIYTDTPELVLRTDTPSWKNNTPIIENLVGQARERGLEFSSDNPLVLSGLELTRDDNGDNYYGILVQIGDNTVAVNDPRFAYGKDKIQFGNQSKKLWTKDKGLSRVYFGWNGVESYDDDLQDSNVNGRVVVFDAEGVASESMVGWWCLTPKASHLNILNLKLSNKNTKQIYLP
jgi:hypothetical protein